MRVVAIKTLKGRAENHLFFSPRERQHVANAIFKLLSKATCPTVVLGNIGFALDSCLTHLAEYRDDTGEDVDHKLQILTTADQEVVSSLEYQVVSLFKAPFKPSTVTQSTLIEADAPKRMMIIGLDTDTPAPVHTVLDTNDTPVAVLHPTVGS